MCKIIFIYLKSFIRSKITPSDNKDDSFTDFYSRLNSSKYPLIIANLMTFQSFRYIWVGKSFNFGIKKYRNIFYDLKRGGIVYSNILSDIVANGGKDIELHSLDSEFMTKLPVIDIVTRQTSSEIISDTKFRDKIIFRQVTIGSHYEDKENILKLFNK